MCWIGEKCVEVTGIRDPKARDLPDIADGTGGHHLERRVRRYQRIQIAHGAVLPEERPRISARWTGRADRSAHDVTAAVHGQAGAHEIAFQYPEIPNALVPGPQKWMKGRTAWQGGKTGHSKPFPSVVHSRLANPKFCSKYRGPRNTAQRGTFNSMFRRMASGSS
jgi:hypothetical protein